ncbi:MAG TPA: hypothetical protein ENN84_10635 [Candidatus Marinimicrobia bacterium]|nr:hypothetical protein [Candidatus Neomarinimicrobiota bacterium]
MKLHLGNAPFTHKDRADDHYYQGRHFPAELHYNDFIIHFHGWYNHIDSVNSYFQLEKQFLSARKNAILSIPQGPKNAPDSFGGKLSEQGGLERFLTELTDSLIARKVLRSHKPGNIILTGHSGGYSPIAYILMHGGLRNHIMEVQLYDGIYSHLEKYVWWIRNQEARFFYIMTENGGTKILHRQLADSLRACGLLFLEMQEANLSIETAAQNKIILCHSNLGNNEVLHQQENYRKLIAASILKPLKD